MKGIIALVKDFEIEPTDKEKLHFRIVIDYKDCSYSVYYVHIVNNEFIVDNRKVDPDCVYGNKCNAIQVDKFLTDELYTSFMCCLLDQ